ncbi:MAG: hypothetical protein LC768_13580 [Acidobacteria bacterium]|nr:hypothetical protein [Acidobacteriota bacterium]MCA1639341.1 hypothetical protein [Acidobacteriota bacterium]
MKKILQTQRKHQTTITAHLKLMLMIFTLVAASFAAGYYAASAQIAAMLNN